MARAYSYPTGSGMRDAMQEQEILQEADPPTLRGPRCMNKEGRRARGVSAKKAAKKNHSPLNYEGAPWRPLKVTQNCDIWSSRVL